MPVWKTPCFFRRLVQKRSCHKRLRWVMNLCSVAFILSHTPVVSADVPAETDFGQVTMERVWSTVDTDSVGNEPAVFITFYPDGKGVCEVRSITDDSVVGFVGEHPAWKLDEGFMWFVQMPVYVRVLGQKQASDTIDQV